MSTVPLPSDHPNSIHNVTSKAFRQFLRYKLQQYNISQTDASKATGVSNGVISQWIRNKYYGDNRRIGEVLRGYMQEVDRVKGPEGKYQTDLVAFQTTLESGVGSDDDQEQQRDGQDESTLQRQLPRPSLPPVRQKSPLITFTTSFNTLPPTLDFMHDITSSASPPPVPEQPHLIPLIIDLTVETLHYHDYLLWNLNDIYLTVEAFVAELLSDLRLLPYQAWYQPLVHTIQQQIAAYEQQHGREIRDLTQYYSEDELLSIPVDITYNGIHLRDQFLYAPLSDGQLAGGTGRSGSSDAVMNWSQTLCTDLALPAEWKVVLTCHIQHQLLRDLHQRKQGQAPTLKVIRREDITSSYRTMAEAKQYSPMMMLESESQHEPLSDTMLELKA